MRHFYYQADYNNAKMPGSASLFHMHVVLESDYAILTYISQFFALCRGRKEGGVEGGAWHNTPTLNTPLDVHVFTVTAY